MLSLPFRKYPIGLQDFSGLRRDGYIYIDKTSYIYLLAHTGKQYFLSRPRRFGKSLFLSTLRAYWEGKKDLFEGLSVERLENSNPEAWEAYPVFYIDFNRDDFEKRRDLSLKYSSKNEKTEGQGSSISQGTVSCSLEGILEAHLEEWEEEYGCRKKEASLAVRFQNLLKTAAETQGKRCVVLVDEYDKPLLEALGDKEREDHYKAVYKGFFSALKSYEKYLQFVFITGVTKFSKISIFSDLNQLEDISFDEDYAGICGITQEEMLGTFASEIHKMAEGLEMTDDECLKKLKETYDGYRFSSGPTSVYNPHSLLNAFKKRKLGFYWFETGTPTFLVRKLRELNFDVRKLSDLSLQTTERVLSDYREDNPDPIPLLYQTGYLSIRDHDRAANIYTLGFPNSEVEYGFLESLMPEYVADSGAGSGKDILSIKRYLETGDLGRLRDALTALFAGIPYTKQEDPFENYFQSVIYIIFTLLGQYVQCEVHSFQGRADCIVETKKYVYLFEFKRDATAKEALKQIEDKGYALVYQADTRTLYRVGAGFDSKNRMLTDWEVY